MVIPYIVSYSDFREHLAEHLDRVIDDSMPMVVLRKNGKKVVVVSEDDYNSMDETDYLLSSPANARHLKEALKESHNKSRKRKIYKSVDEIRKEFGID